MGDCVGFEAILLVLQNKLVHYAKRKMFLVIVDKALVCIHVHVNEQDTFKPNLPTPEWVMSSTWIFAYVRV